MRAVLVLVLLGAGSCSFDWDSLSSGRDDAIDAGLIDADPAPEIDAAAGVIDAGFIPIDAAIDATPPPDAGPE